jgi:hypothetical protein
MRKITLLLAFIAFVGFSFAQNCDLNNGVKVKIEKATYQQQTKAAFDVIWSEDFNETKWKSSVETQGQGYKLIGDGENLPTGWTVHDGTDKKFYWHWSDVGPRGKYVSSGTDCTVPRDNILQYLPGTTDNGFMMLESAWYNTTENCNMVNPPVKMDSYIQYGPVNLSGHPYVIFNIHAFFRFCCDSKASLAVEFSTNYNPADGTGDWKTINLNVITQGNDYTVLKERNQHLNVSSIVGDQSSVYFRVHQTLSSHYFFMIDDVSFYVAPDHDVQLKDGWADYLYNALVDTVVPYSDKQSYNFWGGYAQIPNNVVGKYVQFRTAVYNNGANDVTNLVATTKIFKDGGTDPVYTVATTPKTLAAINADTLIVAADFTPTVGHYQVSMTVDMNENDQITSDNGWGCDFSVVKDSVYSRVRHGHEADFGAGGPTDWHSGGKDGDMVAQRYAFPASVENGIVKAKGVQVYIPSFSSYQNILAAINAGSISLIGHIYNGNLKNPTNVKTNTYTLAISDTSSWIYLPFVDEGNLDLPVNNDNKLYYAVVEIYTGNITIRFRVGADDYVKQPALGGVWYSTEDQKWYWGKSNYAIDLVIYNPNVGSSVNTAKVLDNVRIYPNPFNNVVTVENLNNSKNITISNVLGQTVMNVPVTGSTVEINTANLDKGVYLITIVDNNNNMRTEKLIKK